MPWALTFESEPRSPPALCICVLSELEPLSNHEEQLSCPASWCAHSSAAVSGLLQHQMAVSILRSAAISFFRQVTIFPLLYVRKMSQQMSSCRHTILRGSLLHASVFWGLQGPSQLWNGPQHSSSYPDQGEGSVLRICVCDEGDSRLAGSSSG